MSNSKLDSKQPTCSDPKRLLELEVGALRAERDLLQYLLKVRGEDIKQANLEHLEELEVLKRDNLELHRQIKELKYVEDRYLEVKKDSDILNKFISEFEGKHRLVGHKLACDSLAHNSRTDCSITLKEVPVYEWVMHSDCVSSFKQAVYNLGRT